MLNRREERRREIAAALSLPHPDLVLLSVKLNIPGSVKQNDTLHALFRVAEAAIGETLRTHEIAVRRHEVVRRATGSESLWVLSADAFEVKTLMVAIEDHHPLGRLFDVDVETQDGAVTRESLGLPERTCFLCGRSAKLCARSRTHSVDDMTQWIETLVEREGGRYGLSPIWEDARLSNRQG